MFMFLLRCDVQVPLSIRCWFFRMLFWEVAFLERSSDRITNEVGKNFVNRIICSDYATFLRSVLSTWICWKSSSLFLLVIIFEWWGGIHRHLEKQGNWEMFLTMSLEVVDQTLGDGELGNRFFPEVYEPIASKRPEVREICLESQSWSNFLCSWLLYINLQYVVYAVAWNFKAARRRIFWGYLFIFACVRSNNLRIRLVN